MDLIDVSVGVAPMYDEGRNLVGISAIVSDIGERRARERPSKCLMREVSHRSKNLLAVVQAIDSQTALHRITFDGCRADRHYGAQDLLVGGNWTGASVADLVRTQLPPFAETTFSRFDRTGPRLELREGLRWTLSAPTSSDIGEG
jgi:HWE histidine kinase